MAIEKHIQIVKKGAQTINEFKRENPGVQFDLAVQIYVGLNWNMQI